MDWENNDRILAVVTDLRKELLKAMLSEDNGQDASPPDPAASPPAFAPFSFDHTEVGHAFGLVPAAFTTAARAAQALASDPSGRAACLAARGEEGRPAGASSGEEEAWALFVASDAPIVVAMAEASPSLQGHAFTAGNASGTIGNVWMQARASWRGRGRLLHEASLCSDPLLGYLCSVRASDDQRSSFGSGATPHLHLRQD